MDEHNAMLYQEKDVEVELTDESNRHRTFEEYNVDDVAKANGS